MNALPLALSALVLLAAPVAGAQPVERVDTPRSVALWPVAWGPMPSAVSQAVEAAEPTWDVLCESGADALPDADRQRLRAGVALRAAIPWTLPDSARAACDASLAAFRARALGLRQSDPVLRLGTLAVLAAEGQAVAFERTLDGDRRVVAFNGGDADAFLPLGDGGVPAPLVAVFVSRDDVGPVPSAVGLIDDDRTVWGLKIPPRTTVVFRPAEAGDVRPHGLDE